LVARRAAAFHAYKNFLRIRIKDNEVTIYPVGLDRVPARNEWQENAIPAGGPVFRPPEPLAVHLIEPPIMVRA
jgi:hypothetical protein